LTNGLAFPVTSRFLALYLRLVARSASVKFILPSQSSLEPVAPDIVLTEASISLAKPPALFLFWNAHSLLLITAFLSSNLFRELQSSFVALVDDSYGGRFTAALFSHLMIPWRRLAYTSPSLRLEDLTTLLRERPNLVMAADSHGPYRRIRPGMARMVRSYGNSFRPIFAACSRPFPLFRDIHMPFPLVRSRISVALGDLTMLPSDRRTIADDQAAIAGALNALASLPSVSPNDI
jgi:lysophospholipid acyltransferase (LPLAT)-like uncharacterized protein